MSVAERWGLPAAFEPARFPIPDGVKDVLRDLLTANEPVLVSIANEGDTIIVVATTQRFFSVRAGTVGGAGVTGFNVREYPWEGVTNLTLQQPALNCAIVVHFKSNDGKTVETGRRAKLAKDATEKLMPFELNAGTQAFNAAYQLWQAYLHAPKAEVEETF
jgi:hypothetical protein